MATAKKLPSGSWRCRVYDYTDENGKKHYKSFTSDNPKPAGKREAEAAAAAYAVSKKTAAPRSLTFQAALEAYIEKRSVVLSPSSVREYKRARKNYDDLKNIRIDEITQEDIQKHINAFNNGHSPKSVRDNHALISAVLRETRPDFALNTVLPQKVRPQLYVPTDDDIKKVMEAAKGTEMEIPILLAAFGPMRRGEICALDRSDIAGTRVHVHRNMVLDENRKYIIKSPKSYAGDRFIDFPSFITDQIPKGNGRVTELNPNMITQRFNHVLKHAGVPHFRFHDCRHYCASIMHAIGVPDAYIMERGGWGNDGTLKNVYRHAMEDQREKMSNKTNGHFDAMFNSL